ncbi:MAG: hypothetical protein EBT17_00455 [Actinobacteria bacterium]|jgi:hypothetical protein|nr:hypothetical protein [Actinomycetota bacterium]NDG76722.1 hypothetical protein [Acidimicrobiia bacterium]NBO33118.1 hypothetical protein [Actinomycetota bacterium]NBO81006.1 hypothetical protein [Actinomycetota bacterium]NBP18255.1 hypothetical protein [Actinomycetota bacterium]
MFRRLFWFALGALAALFGYGWLRRKADSAATKESVDGFIDSLVDGVLAMKERVTQTVGGASERSRESTSNDLFE